MAVYQYIAREKTGSEFTGTYDNVHSVADLRQEMEKIDCVLIKARRKSSFSIKLRKIRQSEIITFVYKFAGMHSAGLSIAESLQTLEDHTEHPPFKYVIADIRKRVEAGSSLKNAFENHRDIFSNFFIGMVEAGEASGKLTQTLEMAADYLEKRNDIKRKLRSAFVYPITVSVMCFLIVTALILFVVPVFSELYQNLNVSLPLPTQVLINLSNFFRSRWWMFPIIIVVGLLLIKNISKKNWVGRKWDALKLNMPFFGKLNRMIIVSSFMRTFAVLASTGISLIKTLEVANMVAHNSKISEITAQLQKSIESGNSVGSSLKKHDIFPPIIIQLALSGEESGKLPEMLNKGVDFLEKDVNHIIKSLLVKLEPALTVIMGIIVGFILMAVYLPMFDYMAHLD